MQLTNKDLINCRGHNKGGYNIDYFGTEVYTFDATSSERVVSLIMLYTANSFHGFQITTRNGNGQPNVKSAFLGPAASGTGRSLGGTFQVFAANVGSGLICGFGASISNWVDAFGFVFLKKVVSSTVDPVVVNLDNYGYSAPNTVVARLTYPCARDFKGNPLNLCTTNSQELAVTSETTNSVEVSKSETYGWGTSTSVGFNLGIFSFGSKFCQYCSLDQFAMQNCFTFELS